jgi:putative ABC transport system substrate-binding protein
MALAPKRLELLHELIPAPAVIAMLVNPTSPYVEPETKDVMASALALGRQVRVLNASTGQEIDTAFTTQQGAGALLVSGDPFFDSQRDRLIVLAAHHAIPAIYQWREFTIIGGLMSYGTSILDAYRQSGIYVGKILKGAKPADLPVMQPTKFEFVINLRTSKHSVSKFRLSFSPLLTRLLSDETARVHHHSRLRGGVAACGAGAAAQPLETAGCTVGVS